MRPASKALGSHPGLGHLDVTTHLHPQKRLALTDATYIPTGDPVRGYEIHIGHTTGPDCDRPWLQLQSRPEGASSPNGRIRGAYLHGLFSSDRFRAAYLAELGAPSANVSYEATVETTLDELADHIEQHLDLNQLLQLAQPITR